LGRGRGGREAQRPCVYKTPTHAQKCTQSACLTKALVKKTSVLVGGVKAHARERVGA